MDEGHENDGEDERHGRFERGALRQVRMRLVHEGRISPATKAAFVLAVYRPQASHGPVCTKVSLFSTEAVGTYGYLPFTGFPLD